MVIWCHKDEGNHPNTCLVSQAKGNKTQSMFGFATATEQGTESLLVLLTRPRDTNSVLLMPWGPRKPNLDISLQKLGKGPQSLMFVWVFKDEGNDAYMFLSLQGHKT